MLNNEIVKKIEDFVYSQPRSIQEIASHINKSWRTADRYIQQIEKDFGTLATKTFRKGTRGALKIVYWNSIEKISNNIFQERLEKDILYGKNKEDFSAFDIYQFIEDKNKQVEIEKTKSEGKTNLENFSNALLKTKKQLLIFSGNLSFINLKNNNLNIFEIIEKLVKNNISIKIICRVDIAGKSNIEKILSLNYKYGKELIEIRHSKQPLRAVIIDKKFFRIKEVLKPTGKANELKDKTFIFYTIKDKKWTEWLSKIFWKIFSSSIDSKKRLEEIEKIK